MHNSGVGQCEIDIAKSLVFLSKHDRAFWIRNMSIYNEVLCILENEVICFKLGNVKDKHIRKIGDVDFMTCNVRNLQYGWAWGDENEPDQYVQELLFYIFSSAQDPRSLADNLERLKISVTKSIYQTCNTESKTKE